MKKLSLLVLSLTTLVACNTTTSELNNTVTLTQDPSQEVTTFKREIVSKTLGDAPNFAQTSNGNFSAVISRGFGRGAKAGAIVEFLYPLYARDHLWDSYNGVYYNDKLNWFHEMTLVNQSVKDDTGIIISQFKTKDNKLAFKTSDVAMRDNDTLVRHLEVTNTSGETINDIRLFFYEFFTVNYLGAGDHLTYDKDKGTLIHTNGSITFTIGSDIKPEQFQCGGAENLLTNAYDARRDAEDGTLRGNTSVDAGIGLGVNGNIGHNITSLKPNQKFEINYYISVGKSGQESTDNYNRAKTQKWNDIQQNDISYWKSWLSQAKMPKGTDERINRVYKRALITLKQDTANNGAVIASPTVFTPVYAFSWPRDGAITSSAYLEAGYTEEARKFIDFISTQQKENGGWPVNFFVDGSRPLWDFGDRKNEHDQVGTVNWIIYEYYKHTNDLAWLKAKWPVVEKASDFLVDFDSDQDLMTSCRDLWELHTDKSWTYTNAAAYAGLKAGSEIAKLIGNETLSTKYSLVAERMKKSIHDKLWSEQGQYYIRGLNLDNHEIDDKVESANIGLSYPFNVFDYNDPRMIKTADKIYSSLGSSQKGISRYTGDQYYDGNPWPATTDWLAIYYARAGNKSRAVQLHNTITNYAYQTDSLMLGEQFDEQRKLWVSAFPLTWSESKYVLATLDIYK